MVTCRLFVLVQLQRPWLGHLLMLLPVIFGKEPVHCPTARECYCKVFGVCDLDCKSEGDCQRYDLPPYSTLPNGWPYIGWGGVPRNRSGPVG